MNKQSFGACGKKSRLRGGMRGDMSVFRYEWVKLVKKKLFLLIAVLLFAGNLLTLYTYEKHTPAYHYIYEQKERYQAYLAGDEAADTDGYYRQDREAQESYIGSYAAFVGEMQARADRMMGTAIYADPESYVYRNIVKSCGDFAPFTAAVLRADNCFGLRALAGYRDGAVFVLLFLAVLSYYVLFYERDMNLLLLLKGSRNGHLPLAAAKLGMTVSAAVLYTAMQEGANILFLGWLYGYGELGRAVQSVSLFRNCVYPLTVLGALSAILLIRMSIAAVLACLFYGLGMLFKSAPFVFLTAGGGLLAEYVFSRIFSLSGTFGSLKCINPFYCWDMEQVLGEYYNLNVFGYPTGKNLCAAAAAAVTALLFTAWGLFAFCKTCQVKKEGLPERMMRQLRGLAACLHRRTGLLYYEFDKMLIQQKKGIVVLILLAWCVSESSGVFDALHYGTAKTASYHYYISQIGGRITEDTFLLIAQEEAFFEEVRRGAGSKLSKEEQLRWQEQAARADMLEEGFDMVKDQLEALQGSPGSIWDKYLLDEMFYEELWGDTGTDLLTWFGGSAILLYLISGIYTMDEKKKMRFLIRSTRYGRVRIDRSRNLCAFLCTGIVFVMTELPLFLRYYKIDHFSTAAQKVCDITTENFTSAVPLGIMILLLFLLKAAGFAAVCFAELKVSRAVKSEMPAMLAGIGFAGVVTVILYHFEADFATLLIRLL